MLCTVTFPGQWAKHSGRTFFSGISMEVSDFASGALLTHATIMLQCGSEHGHKAQGRWEKHGHLYDAAAWGVSQGAKHRKRWGNVGTRVMLRHSTELGVNRRVRPSRVFAPIMLLCRTELDAECCKIGPTGLWPFIFPHNLLIFLSHSSPTMSNWPRESKVSALVPGGGDT